MENIWRSIADGRLLVVGMGDGARIWDLQSYREVAFLPTGRTPSPIFTQNGNELITSGESGLQRWPLKYQSSTAFTAPDDATLEGIEQIHVTGDAESTTKTRASIVLQFGTPRVPLAVDSKFHSTANGGLGFCSTNSNKGMIVNLE